MSSETVLTKIAVFKGKHIRRHWDEDQKKWFFCIVDIVEVLTGSPNPRSYWKVLKNRLKKEGSEVVTKCNHLKMQAADGKYYLTDAGGYGNNVQDHPVDPFAQSGAVQAVAGPYRQRAS